MKQKVRIKRTKKKLKQTQKKKSRMEVLCPSYSIEDEIRFNKSQILIQIQLLSNKKPTNLVPLLQHFIRIKKDFIRHSMLHV